VTEVRFLSIGPTKNRPLNSRLRQNANYAGSHHRSYNWLASFLVTSVASVRTWFQFFPHHMGSSVQLSVI